MIYLNYKPTHQKLKKKIQNKSLIEMVAAERVQQMIDFVRTHIEQATQIQTENQHPLDIVINAIEASVGDCKPQTYSQ